MAMSVKLELPDNVVRELLDQWRDEAAQLDGRLTELSERIKSAEAQLNGQFPKTKQTTTGSTADKPSKGKRRKGENLRIIQEYFRRLTGTGATIAAISKGTGIGLSSVRVVLKRHKDTFSEDQGGLWKMKG